MGVSFVARSLACIIVYNICCLGALVDVTQILESETVLNVLDKKVPKDVLKMNNRAFGLFLSSQYQYSQFT